MKTAMKLRIGDTEKGYAQLLSMLRKTALLGSVNGLLGWDTEVYMPKGEADFRAEQRALMASLCHESFIDPEMGKLLGKLSKSNLTEEQRIVVDETLDDYEKATCVPTALVHKFEETTSKAFIIWEKAKQGNDFKSFAPILKEIIDLNIKIAGLQYPGMNPYEALIKGYDRDLSLKKISSLLTETRNGIKPILKKAKKQDTAPLEIKIPVETQKAYNHQLARAIGLDFNRARLDESTHPFTSDSRITTRYDHGWWGAISATMHESGHAMYDLGLDRKQLGNPLGSSISMSVHESQSRIWENHVGKGMPFWKHHFPILQKSYAPALGKFTLEKFYAAINNSEPSLNRVEADELTYPLHIILRFEMEKDLICGRMNVEEIPSVWNEKMKNLLGITPPDDSQGCLQDVHWSMGYFGYFPTYVIGSMMSAQIYNAARKNMPNLDSDFEKGNTANFLSWLRANIHAHGRRYKTEILMKKVTGKGVDAVDYIRYLNEKFSKIA